MTFKFSIAALTNPKPKIKQTVPIRWMNTGFSLKLNFNTFSRRNILYRVNITPSGPTRVIRFLTRLNQAAVRQAIPLRAPVKSHR